ncbi:AEC family transporter [Actinomadura rugatobispora]|uniref:AEC family transporter n=1 Tax=Actinomadura rugatobispora TaxID=1994 RepID=A0ABW1A984_9ACTN|nr:AEC family transporter [Actinomadura rugatobispora]
MAGVVTAFAALVAVALLGYLAGVAGVLRAQDELVLSRLAFFVATPALMFTTVATADLGSIFSPVLPVNVLAVAAVQAVYLAAARWVLRRRRSETTIGVLASSYVNAGNLGIPVSVYVLGDGALVAPILLFQLLVMTPVAFLVLDGGAGEGGRAHAVRAALLRPLRNPLTVASLLGLGVAVAGVEPPEPLMRPVELVAGAAVPVALIAYGLSLRGRRHAEEEDAGVRRDIALAVVLKIFLQPAVAYLAGRYAFGLDGGALLASTLFAALPTAQNIYVYAVHYGTATRLARSAVLASTLLSIPVMITLGGLLA